MDRKNILIADNPELQQHMGRSFFRRASFNILVTGNGKEAFEIIEAQDPALAILDLNMSQQNGDECCHKVKNDPFLRATPIALLTPTRKDEDIERCRAAGCDEILFCPLDTQHLIDVACRLLKIDRRAPTRIPTCIPAFCGSFGEKLDKGVIHNLNAGGVYIETPALLPVDNFLTIEFSLPENPLLIRCRCRVAWVNHPEWIKAPHLPVGMGVQFYEMAPEGSAAIKEFVKRKGIPQKE